MSNTALKIGADLYKIQMKWALWFLLIVLVVQFALLILVPEPEIRDLSYLMFTFQPTKIFMLICGMIVIFAFFTLFIKQGVTRKDFFAGMAIAGVWLAFTMIIISALIAGILMFIGNFTPLFSDMTTSTFLNTQSDWIVPILALSLIILVYYLAGWMIGIGFYRFGGLGGLGFIALAITFMTVADILWESEISHPLAGFINLNLSELAIPVSLTGTLILQGLGLWMIRTVTRRVTIKME